MSDTSQIALLQGVEAELEQAAQALAWAPTALGWQAPLRNAAYLLEQAKIFSPCAEGAAPTAQALQNIRKLVARCEALLDSGLAVLCGCNAVLDQRPELSGYERT
jgi:hypothetical protein